MQQSSLGDYERIEEFDHRLICSTCRAVSFETIGAVEEHNAEEHGRSQSGAGIQCPNCGSVQRYVRSRIESGVSDWCSVHCKERLRRERAIRAVEECYRRHGEVTHKTIKEDDTLLSPRPIINSFRSVSNAIVKAGIAEYNRCPDCYTAYQRLGRHWNETDCSPPPLTDRQKQIVTGLVMGDGSVVGDGSSCCLKVTGTNREFIEWVESELGVFACGVNLDSTGEQLLNRSLKWGDPNLSDDPQFKDQYRARSFTTDRFQQWRDWYLDEGIRFPDSLSLSPLTTAVWYACDGSLCRNSATYVPRFGSLNESHRPEFVKSLFNEVGFHPQIYGVEIRLPAAESDDFLEWMGDPIPGHESKWARTESEWERLKSD